MSMLTMSVPVACCVKRKQALDQNLYETHRTTEHVAVLICIENAIVDVDCSRCN
jgi:hypothetical protein